jgi:hypothetical protein
MLHSFYHRCQTIGRFTFIRLLLVAQLCLLAGLTGLHAQTIRYVKEGGTGTGTGDWSNASADLQLIINASSPGDQVWVATGTYKPGDQRYHSFELKNGIAVYGGFSGNEAVFTERVLTYPSSTTLSGELGDPQDSSDNSYHIVSCFYAELPTILDGFVITGGNANGSEDDGTGGAMFIIGECEEVRPTIQNCYFTNNRANAGSGLFVFGNSIMTLTNCVFFNNLPNGDESGEVILTTADRITLVNCTLVGNRSKLGNVIRSEEKLIMTNCILWNNKPAGDGEDGPDITGAGSLTVTHTINQDNLAGTGNQTANPNFVNESTGDLRLTPCSIAINSGDLDSYTAVGGPDKDIAGLVRVFGNYIDLGAFEFQGVQVPTLALPPAITKPILQNTPYVTLTVTGCDGGTVSWTGPNGASGSGTTISVPTSATGTLVYSATCIVGSCPSPPGSATVTVSPPLVSGSFDGFVYGADCATFRGWAWDRNKPNTAVSINILDGPKVIATLEADVFRQDLQTAGKGNGKHAFFFTIPDNLKDGKPHYLSARVNGSSFILKDSPKVLICEGIPAPGGNKPPKPPTPTILIAPLAAQVGVPFSGTLVAFTDPEGQPLTYKLSGLPDGLSINENTRVISGTPTEAGTFVLTYQATDPGPLTNSVSFPLTVNPASTTTVTGSFEGYLDKVECGTIRGWVWDRNKPNTPVTVEFYTGSTVWGSVVANIYRDDLKTAGKGNGAHGYSFTVPPALKDNMTHVIYGRVQGSTYVLKDSGKPLICPSPVRLSAETSPELQVTVLGNPVSDQLTVEIRGAEGQPLQLQLGNVNGRLVSQRLIEVAKTVERQSFSVEQQPAGLLLLRVQSGLHRRTLKVLKQ